jgi:uncharacterized membrane protein
VPEWDSNSGDEDARKRITVYAVVIVILLINFVVISLALLSFYDEVNSIGISSSHTLRLMGRDTAVGMATRYELDAPASNAGGGEIFRTHRGRPWGPPNLLYEWHLVSFTMGLTLTQPLTEMSTRLPFLG